MTRPHSASVVFVTGGSSGIGYGLAAAYFDRGATVIIGGRSEAKLSAVVARHPGMEMMQIDVADAASVARCFADLGSRHPGLNVVINNAGIQRIVDFAANGLAAADAIDEEIDINLKGLIRVSAAAIPILRRQPSARLIHIGSGLGYVPLTSAPMYSATKAAVHSFTISLREQLKDTPVKVIEIIPPVVETGLHDAQTRKPPNAMPLEAFVKAAIAGIDRGKLEIPVGLAKALRIGSRVAPAFFLRIVNKPR